jgi:hypothetical protein
MLAAAERPVVGAGQQATVDAIGNIVIRLQS